MSIFGTCFLFFILLIDFSYSCELKMTSYGILARQLNPSLYFGSFISLNSFATPYITTNSMVIKIMNIEGILIDTIIHSFETDDRYLINTLENIECNQIVAFSVNGAASFSSSFIQFMKQNKVAYLERLTQETGYLGSYVLLLRKQKNYMEVLIENFDHQGNFVNIEFDCSDLLAECKEKNEQNTPLPDISIDNLISQMTLNEKIAQMLMADVWLDKGSDMTSYSFERNEAEISSIISQYGLGGVLYGANSVWPLGGVNLESINRRLQNSALSSRMKIPVAIAIDAVHGNGIVRGNTIYPHNIGLGGTRNEKLVRQIGRETAKDVRRNGLHWVLGPCIAVGEDARWGRFFETFSSNESIVSSLGKAMIEGLQDSDFSVSACAKHYFGDGAVDYGTGRKKTSLDQGDIRNKSNIHEIITKHIKPYKSAIEAGVDSIMLSYSSLLGVPMHSNPEMIDKLRKEMKFDGVILSDWDATSNLCPQCWNTKENFEKYTNKGENYPISVVVATGEVCFGQDDLTCTFHEQYARAINSGVDMIMMPGNFERHFTGIKQVVCNNLENAERQSDTISRSEECKNGNRTFIERTSGLYFQKLNYLMNRWKNTDLETRDNYFQTRAVGQVCCVPESRINEANKRILNMKKKRGLLNNQQVMFAHPSLSQIPSNEEKKVTKALAREAAQKSSVVLFNENIIPLPRGADILVACAGSHDRRRQLGGWSLTWQGASPDMFVPLNSSFDQPWVNVSSMLISMRENFWCKGCVFYSLNGTDYRTTDVAIAVVSEEPYAEYHGDRASPNEKGIILNREDEICLNNLYLKKPERPIIIVAVSGRPIDLSRYYEIDREGNAKGKKGVKAIVATWLMGEMGEGVSDILRGYHAPIANLSCNWFDFPLNHHTSIDKRSTGCGCMRAPDGMYWLVYIAIIMPVILLFLLICGCTFCDVLFCRARRVGNL